MTGTDKSCCTHQVQILILIRALVQVALQHFCFLLWVGQFINQELWNTMEIILLFYKLVQL